VFNIGSQELLVILVLVFLLFGPRHIPEVARALGKGLGDVQRALRGVEENVRRATDDLPRRVDAPESPVGSIPRRAVRDPEALAGPTASDGPPEIAAASEPPGRLDGPAPGEPRRTEPT